ncbi:hypothetical protein BGZ60DRAFT_418487 [Tricladium varicosporioides]|nr:hypothetical protein BGZ60DRAFT_418487 [Hymenoscyphus varicosporioides]
MHLKWDAETGSPSQYQDLLTQTLDDQYLTAFDSYLDSSGFLDESLLCNNTLFDSSTLLIGQDTTEESLLLEDAASQSSEKANGGPGHHDKPPVAASQQRIKKGPRFSQAALAVLKNWISTNRHAPYPTEEQKVHLSEASGLSKAQVTTWLANSRRRGRQQKGRSSTNSTQHVSSSRCIPRPPTPALQQMNPFERWRSSPPEEEHAFPLDVLNTINGTHLPNSSNLDFASTYFDFDSSPSTQSPSYRTESDTSSQSAYSGNSASSIHSRKARNRRRCRRLPVVPNPSTRIGSIAGHHTYQCTFCTKSFKRKHDWKRHEQSMHLSPEQWICAPNGATFLDPETQIECCTFCQLPEPDDAHLEIHKFSACSAKALEKRTFYREDHLRQHLRLLHNATFQPTPMGSWRVESGLIKSRCGFCDKHLETWPDRVEHLAAHFAAGSDMAEWKGGWGFEPEIQRLVENGIPPYLIHIDRQTLLPFCPAEDTCDRSGCKATGLSLGNISTSLELCDIEDILMCSGDGSVTRKEASFPEFISDFPAGYLLSPADCAGDIPQLGPSEPEPTFLGDTNSYQRLRYELLRYVASCLSVNNPARHLPSNAELQNQARWIIFDDDDPWNQTAADNAQWMAEFKKDAGLL